MSSKKEKTKKKGRMDFVLDKVEPIPGKENVFKFQMRPDPRVWKLLEENGKKAWYNKVDKSLIPLEEFEEAIKKMSGIPVVASNIQVEVVEEYIEKSKRRIKEDVSKRK